jgi:hypothetical protein
MKTIHTEGGESEMRQKSSNQEVTEKGRGRNRAAASRLSQMSGKIETEINHKEQQSWSE